MQIRLDPRLSYVALENSIKKNTVNLSFAFLSSCMKSHLTRQLGKHGVHDVAAVPHHQCKLAIYFDNAAKA